MSNFYAVAKGHNVGVYNSWIECKKNIDGFTNPKFKKFSSIEEATLFINSTPKDKDIKDIKDKDIKIYDDYIIVYTDGGCINNGKKNAIGGIGIYFNDDDSRNVSLKLKGDITNNVAELTAILSALKILNKEIVDGKKILIVSDSEYAIKCCTYYGKKLSENNWLSTTTKKTPPNIELVKELYEITSTFNNIKFKHVFSHTGKEDMFSLGNSQADLLANQAMGVIKDDLGGGGDKKIYLNVSYDKKEEAKLLGARWDPSKKKWYSNNNNPKLSLLMDKYK